MATSGSELATLPGNDTVLDNHAQFHPHRRLQQHSARQPPSPLPRPSRAAHQRRRQRQRRPPPRPAASSRRRSPSPNPWAGAAAPAAASGQLRSRAPPPTPPPPPVLTWRRCRMTFWPRRRRTCVRRRRASYAADRLCRVRVATTDVAEVVRTGCCFDVKPGYACVVMGACEVVGWASSCQRRASSFKQSVSLFVRRC